MTADIEIIVSFDDDCWSTTIDNRYISSTGLADLEGHITHIVQQMPCYADQKCVRVRMGFDFDVIPAWLRQYHSHYFNSQLLVTMPFSNRSASTTY